MALYYYYNTSTSAAPTIWYDQGIPDSGTTASTCTVPGWWGPLWYQQQTVPIQAYVPTQQLYQYPYAQTTYVQSAQPLYGQQQAVIEPDAIWKAWIDQVNITQEERAVRVAAREQAAREAEAQRVHAAEVQRQAAEKRQAAEAKADKLLRSILDDEQWASYQREKAVFVTSQTGRKYKVHKGWAGNVVELNAKGHHVRRFCIHPDRHVPDADNMVAQIAMLRFDEARFLRTANPTQLLAA